MDDSDCGCLGWIIVVILGITAVCVVLAVILYIIQTYWPILLAGLGITIAILCSVQGANMRRTNRIEFLENELPHIYSALDQTTASVEKSNEAYRRMTLDMADAVRFSALFEQLSEGERGKTSYTPMKAITLLQLEIDEQVIQHKDLEEKCAYLRESGLAMTSELEQLRAETKK